MAVMVKQTDKFNVKKKKRLNKPGLAFAGLI